MRCVHAVQKVGYFGPVVPGIAAAPHTLLLFGQRGSQSMQGAHRANFLDRSPPVTIFVTPPPPPPPPNNPQNEWALELGIL